MQCRDSLERGEFDARAVVGKEQARDDPGDSLVAVEEAVVSHQSERIRRTEAGGIGVIVSPRILRPGKCRFDGTEIEGFAMLAATLALLLPAPYRLRAVSYFQVCCAP